MILTCPSCASRYFVDDGALPPLGRTVRCSACGGSWRAGGSEAPLTLGAPTSAVAPADPAAPLPRSFRQKVEARRRTRQAIAAGVVWAALAAGVGVLALGSLVFRVQVVRLWPRTAGAYAAMRLPVNPLGLAPDNISAGQGLQNGQVAVIVTGGERNITDRARTPAALRVSLYDKAGAPLMSRVVELAPRPIPAGATRAFTVSLTNPPMAGVQVGVDFLAVEPPARPAPKGDGAPRLRGLEDPIVAPTVHAALARPVSPDSPYALPSAARPQSE